MSTDKLSRRYAKRYNAITSMFFEGGAWQKCIDALEDFLKDFPDNQAAHELLNQAQDYLTNPSEFTRVHLLQQK